MEITFLLFMAFFVAVGLLSARRARDEAEDYWLAGREVKPWAVALSTLSTAQSGFLWLGMVGMAYSAGLQSLWMLFGWLAGDYLIWRFGILKRVRARSEERGATTLASFLGPQQKAGGRRHPVVLLWGLAIFILLAAYASAQLTTGAKVLKELYGWELLSGLGLTAVIVMSYSFAGGARASVWTDCAQGPVMIVGMAWLTWAVLAEVGGPSALWTRLGEVAPGHLAITEDWTLAIIGLVGWTISGMGIVGQPHVLSRIFMIDSPENLKSARRWYFIYGVALYSSTVIIGLGARLIIPPEMLPDPEVAVFIVAQELLPAPVVGLIIAGIFAAVISTVDSMVVVQSSAAVNDVMTHSKAIPRWQPKAFTAIAMLIAMLFSLFSTSVYAMVMAAWPILAMGIGPIVVLRSFDFELDSLDVFSLLSLSLGILYFWGQSPLEQTITGMAPAFLAPIALTWCFRKRPEAEAAEIGDEIDDEIARA